MLLAAPGAGHQGQIEEIAPFRSAVNAVTILVPAYGFMLNSLCLQCIQNNAPISFHDHPPR